MCNLLQCYNANMLLERFSDTVSEKCQLYDKKPVLIGVSGGPDSVCLLDLFHRLDWNILVAHFNHKLRPEADLDQRFVEKTCKERGIPFISGSAEIGPLARASKRSIEEEARINRYHFLFEQARKHHAVAVAVGHNADDQVETVLMHFLRGSGMAGLRGMSFRSIPNEWEKKIPLVRPLLGFWRQEIEDYCVQRKFETISDATNRENTFFRNRLRNELVPFLETFNPKVKERIFTAAVIARGDLDVIADLITAAWDVCSVNVTKQQVIMDRTCFIRQPIGLQRALVKKIIDNLVPENRDIGFHQIQQAIQFAQKGTRSGEMGWFNELLIVAEDDRICFRMTGKRFPSNDFPQIGRDRMINASDTRVELNDPWRLTFEKTTNKTASFLTDHPYTAYLDADAIEYPLVLKYWRQGDRMAPLGLAGKTVKISDIWTRMNVPKRARQRFPVLWDMTRIIWLPGFRQANDVRIEPSTDHILKVSMLRD